MEVIHSSIVIVSKTCPIHVSTCMQDEIYAYEKKVLSTRKIIFRLNCLYSLDSRVKFQRTEKTAHWVLQARNWIHLPNIWIQLSLFIRTKFNFRKKSGIEKISQITSVFHNKNEVETKLNTMLIKIKMRKSNQFCRQ